MDGHERRQRASCDRAGSCYSSRTRSHYFSRGPASQRPASDRPTSRRPAAGGAGAGRAGWGRQGEINGKADPGAEIQVLVDGAPAGKTRADAGAWSLAVPLDQPGERAVAVQTLDSSGQVAAASSLAQISIEILDSDRLIGRATVGAGGTWSVPVTPGVGTASYGIRPVGAATVSGRPIRVTIGTAAAPVRTTLAAGENAWVIRERGLRLRLRDGGSQSGAATAGLIPIRVHASKGGRAV
jgi:hypothetical protein